MMRSTLICLLLAFAAPSFEQAAPVGRGDKSQALLPLEMRIQRFDVTDAILRDGLSELSLKNVEGLHLGFEEIIRDRIQDDPRSLNPHFSLHLEGRTVREILNALCTSDARYTWTEDGTSINVYARTTKDELSYLFNVSISRITVKDIPDPDQGLTPLSKLLPDQQIGYFGSGGNDAYSEPWTASFENLTVRQFINRIAEHLGSQTTWVWQGGKDERMFTFFKAGFHTFRSSPNSDSQQNR